MSHRDGRSAATAAADDPAHARLQKELTGLLAGQFPGLTVEVGHSDRWGRTALTFRWAGFTDLLPEERFHRLFHSIPEELYEARLRGCVWVELGAGETVEEFLKLPRSSEMEDQEPRIIERLLGVGFFDQLAEVLGDHPAAACKGDFASARRILSDKRNSKVDLRDALLVLMRSGAFCDCEALFNARLLALRTAS